MHLPFFALLFTLLIAPTLDAQWEPEQRLTFNDRISLTSYNNAWCIAASKDTVHVVWHDNRQGNGEIYYKRSTDGGTTWGPDTSITNSLTLSALPSLGVNGSTVHVVWSDTRDGNYEIYYRGSMDGGSSWGTETRLTNAPDTSCCPSLSVSESYVHVVWHDRRDGNNEIYYKRSTDGGLTWQSDIRLTFDPDSSDFPSVAASGSDVHVVWRDARNGRANWEIYYKRSSDGGTSWGPDTRLTYDSSWSWGPAIASAGTNVHVVWYDTRSVNYAIFYKRSTDGGVTWGPDTRLNQNAASALGPSIAVSGPNVHAVWDDDRDGNPYLEEIYYKRSTNGGTTWESDTRISLGIGRSHYASVAVSETKVHVTWEDIRDDNWEIYYTRNITGNSGTETAEVRGQRLEVRIKPIPNPFVFFATIPGHEEERFILYDISGRLAGTYQGDRIGENLPPGVYFLRGHIQNSPPIRVVKVR